MRLISLNTWGGRVAKELNTFLIQNQEIEVFCFQEIYHRAAGVHVVQGGIDPNLTLFDDLEILLSNHTPYYRAHYFKTFGLATFVRKDIKVLGEDELFVHKHKGFDPGAEVARHARNVQVVTLDTSHGNLHIFNFHGLWNGKGKGDSEDRLSQSTKLVEYMKGFRERKILCGDFNLLPDTESIKMIENMPMNNLIKEYGVTSTRTSFYDKEIRYSDYIFVDETIKVNDFKVLPDEVSDHSPMLLDFE